MPDLNFHVDRAEAEAYSAAPLLIFKLRVEQVDGPIPIHAIVLHCQIRIEPGGRRYTDEQRESLIELFGAPSQWSQSLRPMLWTHTNTVVPAFSGSTIADLPVPCSYDLNLAATKYFDALGNDGELPLCLLFSGTIFYQAEEGGLQAAPISMDKETSFRLPVRVWKEMIERYYPQSAWLCLNKDCFERLRRYKIHARHVTWEQALETLIDSAEEKVSG